MTSRILVPLDESPQAQKALEYALTEHPEAEISLLTVIDPFDASYRTGVLFSSGVEQWYESEQEAVNERMQEAERIAESHDHTVETTIEVGQPAQTILDHAIDNNYDQIIIGSHGRTGVKRILLGSVAEMIVRRSPIPVTVVR